MLEFSGVTEDLDVNLAEVYCVLFAQSENRLKMIRRFI